jgi:hypothetical protein
MSLLDRLRQALLRPASSAARSVAPAAHSPLQGRLPPFQLPTAELMRFDPQIRIGLGARNGLLLGAQIDVRGDRQDVVRFVERQWSRLWCAGANQLLRAKLYGFLPLEAQFRQITHGEFRRLLEVVALREHHPRTARLLVRDGDIAGFTVPLAGDRVRRVLAPQGLVCTYGAEFDNPYGCSLLERAYPAWHEKWMEGGVKQTVRLRMIKDAYLGDILWYPPDRKVELADGRSVSWQEVARDVVANRVSGGALTLPMVYDHEGRRLVDYSPPRDTGNASAIFQWKRDNDLEIWKALEVPPEIIEAAHTGSGYSGRWIPFAVALSAVQAELGEVVRCVNRDLLRPLVRLNFGVDEVYELQPRSLVEEYRKG